MWNNCAQYESNELEKNTKWSCTNSDGCDEVGLYKFSSIRNRLGDTGIKKEKEQAYFIF